MKQFVRIQLVCQFATDRISLDEDSYHFKNMYKLLNRYGGQLAYEQKEQSLAIKMILPVTSRK